MDMREDECKSIETETDRWRDAFRDAVGAISLKLLLNQLDLESWMTEWLGDEKEYEEEDIECLDWREIALRGIYSCAMEAKKILISEYGLEGSDFTEEDQVA